MLSVLYVLNCAAMCRLDGLGTEAAPNSVIVKWLTVIFGAWTTGICVGLFTFALADWQAGVIVGLGWVLYRAPHLGSYWVPENWHKMWLRAFLPTLPCFAALGYWLQSPIVQSLGWAVPAVAAAALMGIAQATVYNGIRYVFPYWSYKHTAAELLSGTAFGCAALSIMCL